LASNCALSEDEKTLYITADIVFGSGKTQKVKWRFWITVIGWVGSVAVIVAYGTKQYAKT
jgi:hypothetical protein